MRTSAKLRAFESDAYGNLFVMPEVWDRIQHMGIATGRSFVHTKEGEVELVEISPCQYTGYPVDEDLFTISPRPDTFGTIFQYCAKKDMLLSKACQNFNAHFYQFFPTNSLVVSEELYSILTPRNKSIHFLPIDSVLISYGDESVLSCLPKVHPKCWPNDPIHCTVQSLYPGNWDDIGPWI